MIKRIVAYFKSQKVRRELEALTYRELDDIGITRGDIDNIVKDHYQRLVKNSDVSIRDFKLSARELKDIGYT